MENQTNEALKALQKLIKSCGSQRKAAIALGVSAVYLGDILKGRRGISDKMAERLGFERVETFKATRQEDK